MARESAELVDHVRLVEEPECRGHVRPLRDVSREEHMYGRLKAGDACKQLRGQAGGGTELTAELLTTEIVTRSKCLDRDAPSQARDVLGCQPSGGIIGPRTVNTRHQLVSQQRQTRRNLQLRENRRQPCDVVLWPAIIEGDDPIDQLWRLNPENTSCERRWEHRSDSPNHFADSEEARLCEWSYDGHTRHQFRRDE
jgi:hypothetical protein